MVTSVATCVVAQTAAILTPEACEGLSQCMCGGGDTTRRHDGTLDHSAQAG